MTMTEKTAAPKTARKPAAAKVEQAEAFTLAAPEMPEAFREVAEKTVQQAKDSFEKMRTAAEETTDMIEDQMETTRTGVLAFNSKALEAAKANVDAGFNFVSKFMTVKSFSEAIELQTAFARGQFELVSAQSKELQDLATKLANDVAAPVKDAVTKFQKDFKVA